MLSAFLQAAATVQSLRASLSHRRAGLVISAVAMAVMLTRRLFSAYRVTSEGARPDPVAELIAVLISALLLAAFTLLAQQPPGTTRPNDALADASLLSVRRLKAQATALAGFGLVAASLLIYFSYNASRAAITERLSKGSLDLAHLLATSAVRAQARGEDPLLTVTELWERAKSEYPGNYLCVIGNDGRLVLNTGRPDQVGKHVGDTRLPVRDPNDPRDVTGLLRSGRDWAGRNLSQAGEAQIAAYAYDRSLSALVAVHLPASSVDAQIRSAATPWALGFAAVLLVIFPISLGLLHWTTTTSSSVALDSVQKTLESEARYERIVETAHEGIWTIGADGKTTFVNLRMASMLGFSPADMLARPLSDFCDDEGAGVAANNLHRRREGIAEVQDFKFRRKDGTALWTSLSTNPLTDAEGRFNGALAMVTDITERRRLEDQVRQAQKMEAVGMLAGGIAHDFNNILTVIQGNVGLLLDVAQGASALREPASEIEDAANRAANLTRQLLTFSRKQVMRSEALDLNDVVADLAKMLRRVLGEQISLETRLHSAKLIVRADRSMLEQVLLNLAVNARDAMPTGGRLLLTTSVANVTAEQLPAEHELTPGSYAYLRVDDTGSGIDQQVMPHIFEPFFTTKEAGKGTGLGLATVYAIAAQHHGWVSVSSTVGVGSTFRFWLPSCDEVLAVEPPASNREPTFGGETLLVVEDEPAVLALAERALKRHGYRILTARSGVEALQVWAAHGRNIQLLFTDVVMPEGVGGLALAEQLWLENPNLPIVFTSGYSPELMGTSQAATRALEYFLPKPYSSAQLLEIVRQRLDASTSLSAR